MKYTFIIYGKANREPFEESYYEVNGGVAFEDIGIQLNKIDKLAEYSLKSLR
jgi:hypothetical protein